MAFPVQQNKGLVLSYFPNFSISSVFLNYEVYLHGSAAVLILLLSVCSLLRKVTDYSFVFTSKVKTMSIAPECCNAIFLKLIDSKTLCYIYKTTVQFFCPRLDTLLKMIIGLLMCRTPPRLLIFKDHRFETDAVTHLSWGEKEISKVFKVL